MTKVETNDYINIYRQICAKLNSGSWTYNNVRKFLGHGEAVTSFYQAIKTRDPVYVDNGTMVSQDDIRREEALQP